MLAKTASESASDMENLTAQFKIFTGSTENAKKMLDELRVIATKSPLEMTDIAAGAKNLLTYGVAAGKVSKITEQLSEVSAGNGEVMGRLTYAFGQISSLGHLAGTELRQLTEAGFNPLEFIMRKTGETMEQVRGRMEKHGVSVKEVEDALTAATSAGGRFYKLNDEMSQTFSGRVSMMKDQWVQLTAALGEGMNRGLKVAIDATTNALPKMKENFTKIGNAIGDAIGEAVAGNMDKLAAIGELIGSTIMAGLMASIYAGSAKIVEGIAKVSEFLNPFQHAAAAAGINLKQGSQHAGALGFKDYLDAELANRGIKEKAQAVMGGPQPYIPIRAQSQPGDEQWKNNWSSMIRTPESTPNSPVPQQLMKQSDIQKQMLLELKKANQSGSKL